MKIFSDPNPQIDKLKLFAEQMRIAAEDDMPKEGISLLDLEPEHCRWPITERLPHRFCGVPRAAGCSYCDNHAKLAYKGLPQPRGALPAREAA